MTRYEVFMQVVDSGSFTAAAQTLNYTRWRRSWGRRCCCVPGRGWP